MEAPAVVDLGPHLVPGAIRHAQLGLSWKVLAVHQTWTTRRYHDEVCTHEERSGSASACPGRCPDTRQLMASSS